LLLLVPAPTLGALSALVLAPGPVGRALWAASKLWIALVPLAWLSVERRRLSLSPWPRERGREAVWVALAASAVAAVSILCAFEWLSGTGAIDLERLRGLMRDNGLDQTTRFAWLALYFVFVNSLVEEYVWRWFVFRRAEELAGPRWAVLISATAFTAHHVVVFVAQLGLGIGVVGSAGVFVAGFAWAFGYRRYGSIWPGWISHVVADAAGLWCAWRMLFGP
jgi:membrane protease YdiL (CAAX protease family)